MISCENSPPETDLPDVWRGHDWQRSPASRALARAFTPPPAMPVWAWADENVRLQNEDAAEPGEYRSAKTPWTRRLQELWREPWMWMWDYRLTKWKRIRVHEISVQKSSQSGFSEACMNGIRWDASWRPKNTIYAIDTAEEAKKIASRLLRSLQLLDRSIFKGDPNDVKAQEFMLRGMSVLFYGSGSEGKFANKQAPRRINDELEEHLLDNTADNLESRGKTATGGGLQVNLSKPKLKNGPINKAFASGNQEECFVPCPHCGLMQPLTFFSEELDVPFAVEMDEIKDEITGEVVAILPRPLPLGQKRKFKTGRVVFEHCRDALQEWDQLQILTATYYECAAGCRIDEGHKRWMIDRLHWRPMVFNGSPGIVSQHFNDLYSEDDSVAWGRLVIKWLKCKKKGIEGMKEFYNHYLGKVWSEEANATEAADILSNLSGRPLWFVDFANKDGNEVRQVFSDEASALNLITSRQLDTTPLKSFCPPYKRGTIPWMPCRDRRGQPGVLIGSDVGGNYACWVAVAPHLNGIDLAVIDWGWELDPEDVARIVLTERWPFGEQNVSVVKGYMDSRHRGPDVYKACLATRGKLVPVLGIGGATARNVRVWSYNQVATYRPGFRKLDFNAQRAKSALYIDRIKRKRKRLWFPIDVEDDPEFIDQLCQEKQEEDSRGKLFWPDTAINNHYGDALTYTVVGLDFETRAALPPGEAAE